MDTTTLLDVAISDDLPVAAYSPVFEARYPDGRPVVPTEFGMTVDFDHGSGASGDGDLETSFRGDQPWARVAHFGLVTRTLVPFNLPPRIRGCPSAPDGV